MTELVKSKKAYAMAGWPMVLFWLGMLIFACHSSTHMVGAGDTWVAMACGRHFLNHGVDTVEPFSANSHKAGPTEKGIATWPKAAQWIANTVGLETVKYWHPTGWINQNWLTHVIFYWLTHKSPFADAETFSFSSLVYWKFALYIITIVCVFYTGVVLKANPALSAAFACFAMFVGRSFLDIRPAGFSNLAVAVFLLILVLTTYRNILYIWLIVPVAVFWCNVHGGYIYLFIMLVPYTFLHFVTSTSRRWFVSIRLKGLYHTIGAGAAAFLVTIIFNPFHLTNLTHTYVISASEHAKMWRTVFEWHPAFEWSNPVGTGVPFLIMFLIALALLLIWLVVFALGPKVPGKLSRRRDSGRDAVLYRWPQIDLSLVVIAGLTVYMAIRSRRFIPIAAIAACPVMAMLVDQTIRMLSAVYNFSRLNRLVVRPMPKNLQKFLAFITMAAVLFFGTWWGLKFKRVYLDPWPLDAELNSVFMRMTASNAKPFKACQFIRDNKLKGKMLNYWTEGGFIAWGQVPDPNTGRTPLQLFMDGRAQAAYEPTAYRLWSDIMSGGPAVARARFRRRPLGESDFREIGKWIDRQLKKYDVWVALMPAGQFNSNFVKGLEYQANWRVVFINNKQRLFVNIDTPQGKELFQGIFNKKTIFPDEFSRLLTIAHNLLRVGDEEARREGLAYTMRAFELNPSQTPILEMLKGARYIRQSEPLIIDFCRKYFVDFEENKSLYAKQSGYQRKVLTARQVANYLGAVSKKADTELAKFYTNKAEEYARESNSIRALSKW